MTSDGDALQAVFRRLVQAGRLAPVAGEDDERLFADCDLAALAENRLGERADPRVEGDARRTFWQARATDERVIAPSERYYQRCFWMLDEGERAGTIAIANETFGSTLVHVASLYVLPDHRGRGTARATLTALRDALGAHGLGLRLDTSWCWQPAVSLYLRMGMWVHMWKRELTFRWSAAEPAPILDVGERRATFSIVIDGSPKQILEASRRGDRLVLDLDGEGDERDRWLRWDASSTLSLALACESWPLIRSAEQWEDCRGSDLGPPEALAEKIVVWEAWNRHRGWNVVTPRIPGLEHRTWAELSARREREHDDLLRGDA